MVHCYTKHVECPDISCSECNIKTRKEMINMDNKNKNFTGITITKRFGDYHACLENHTGIWGCGKTIHEAIGSVIMNHPEKFNLKIIEK